MIGWLWAAAWAQEPAAWIRVVDPSGVAVEEAQLLPYTRTFGSGRHGLGVFVAVFDGTRAVVELAAGPIRDGVPVPRKRVSFELDAGASATRSVKRRGHTWWVQVLVGPAARGSSVEVQAQ